MSIAETLAAAQAKAAEGKAAVPQTVGGAQLPDAGPSRKMSVTDFMGSGRSNAENYLKVSEHGLTIGTDIKKLIESFPAVIDCAELRACTQVRFGKPPQYIKTYDGRKSTDSRSWSECLALAKSVDSGRQSDPYQTLEMIIRPSEDVKSMKGEDTLAKAGIRLGYTPPYTGVPEASSFLEAVHNAGGDVERSKANVKVGYKDKASNGNTWGIVTFEFVSLVEEPAAA